MSAGHPVSVALTTVEENNMAVDAIPAGYEGAVPHLCCREAVTALEFYRRAFGATEVMRLMQPDGRVGHAEIVIGSARIMLADEFPEMGYKSPQSLGGSPVSIMIYVEDVDTMFNQAVAAGGKVQRPVKDQFYGDRSGTLEDPFGHVWHLATHKEDVSPEEMERRASAASAAASGGGQ